MSDGDRLKRAFRALREMENGAHPRADETLARILDDAGAAPKRRGRRLRAWMLVAAALAISTAAAARTGRFGKAVLALVGGEGVEPPGHGLAERLPAPEQAPSEETPLAHPHEPPPPSPASPDVAPTGLAAPDPAPARPASPQRSAAAAAARVPASSSGKSLPAAVSPASPSAPAPAVDDATGLARATSKDDETYARAHRLHFQGNDAAAALVAWDQYLRDFPQGRFVPEARYNRAIDLLKLRRHAEALEALRPFAEGAYGGYHRDDARAMLRSMPVP
jgi:hypothetical protein